MTTTADRQAADERDPLLERAIQARWPLSLAFALTLLALWQLLDATGTLPDYILSPTAIVTALIAGVTDGNLLSATAATLRRIAPGFLLGATLGITVGLIAGVVRVAEDIFDTFVSLTYPLPKIALFPLVVIWLGFTDRARILVIAISVFYPAFVNAYAGAKGLDKRFIWVAANLQAGRLRTFTQVVLPASMPAVLVGVRISLALSFVLAYATEVIGAGRVGLGVQIQDGYNNLLYGEMYAGIAMFAILGFLADLALRLISVRLVRGQNLNTVGRA